MSKILRIAKSKIKYLEKRTYYAYLTPSELLELIKAGITINKVDIIKAKLYKSNGLSRPNWYYFQLGSLTLDQKGEK